MIEITLPWPPTVNTYYRAFKGRTLISERGRQYARAVAEQVLIQCAAKMYSGRLEVRIEAYPPDKRCRDLDNLFKGLLDSLTKAGVWVDDGQIDHWSIIRMPVGGVVKVEVRAL